jgi:hypothetical protein
MAAQLIVRATCRGLPPPLPLLRGRVGVGESREHESSGLISLRLLRHGLLPPSLIEFRLTRSSLPLLAMTAQTSDSNFKQREDMRSCSRGAMRPRFASASPSFRTEGAGKAGCRLHPRSCAQKAHEWTTGSTGSLRLSLRDSVTAYFVLPGDRAFLPPSPCGLMIHLEPGWAGCISARLDASIGAPGPHDFAVRDHLAPKILPGLVPPSEFWRRRLAASFVRAPADRSREDPPCDPIARPTLSRPSHPTARS